MLIGFRSKADPNLLLILKVLTTAGGITEVVGTARRINPNPFAQKSDKNLGEFKSLSTK